MLKKRMAIAFLAAALAACGAESDDVGAGGTGGVDGTGGTGGVGGTGGTVPEAPVCDDGFTACGGNPVGTWNFDQSCGSVQFPMDISNTLDACNGLPVQAEFVLEGTLTFAEDGTVGNDVHVEQVMAFVLPDACLEGVSSTDPLADVCAGVGAQLVDGFHGTGGCSYEAGACRCAITGTANVTNTQTYEVIGTTMDVVGDATYEFCVRDDDYMVRRRRAGDQKLVHVFTRAN